ncbi:uncharacterized protein LOC122638980 [Telopea speciosissima]|uniref:uncharacterized protein LOC122638980 n=1 Tax=Telopea speciosissima TaxID=54955 RepID=UPI001CC7203A|nr:uncharacterized protein LOC122638980 [Telopea speciosissima]
MNKEVPGTVKNQDSHMTKFEQALNDKVLELQDQLQEVIKGKNQASIHNFHFTTDLAFIDEVWFEPLPKGFKMPVVEQYAGATDPEDHLETFKSLLFFQGTSDAILCRAFPSTLKGAMRQWFSRLPPRSLSNFTALGRAFLAHFVSSRVHKKIAANLLAIKQQSEESIRSFLTRFNKEALQGQNLDLMEKFQALRSGIRDTELKKSLIMDEPGDMYELFSRCEKYINLAEVLAAEREDKTEKKAQEKKEEIPREAGSKLNRDDVDGKNRRDDRKAWVPRAVYREFEPSYIALTHARAHILNEIKDQTTLRWPAKMVKPAHERNKNKYCRFYQDHGHNTEECRQLKGEIEALIQRGRLSRFVKKEANDRRTNYRAREPEGRRRLPPKADKELP